MRRLYIAEHKRKTNEKKNNPEKQNVLDIRSTLQDLSKRHKVDDILFILDPICQALNTLQSDS